MICQIVSEILLPVLAREADKSRVGLAFKGLLGFIIFGMFYLGHLTYVFHQGTAPGGGEVPDPTGSNYLAGAGY